MYCRSAGSFQVRHIFVVALHIRPACLSIGIIHIDDHFFPVIVLLFSYLELYKVRESSVFSGNYLSCQEVGRPVWVACQLHCFANDLLCIKISAASCCFSWSQLVNKKMKQKPLHMMMPFCRKYGLLLLRFPANYRLQSIISNMQP